MDPESPRACNENPSNLACLKGVQMQCFFLPQRKLTGHLTGSLTGALAGRNEWALCLSTPLHEQCMTRCGRNSTIGGDVAASGPTEIECRRTWQKNHHRSYGPYQIFCKDIVVASSIMTDTHTHTHTHTHTRQSTELPRFFSLASVMWLVPCLHAGCFWIQTNLDL